MEEQELIKLERNGLVPAPELYFGRGFGSEPKAVRLRQLRKRAAGIGGPDDGDAAADPAEGGANGANGADGAIAEGEEGGTADDGAKDDAETAAAAAAVGAAAIASAASAAADQGAEAEGGEAGAAGAGADAKGSGWEGTEMEATAVAVNKNKVRKYQLNQLYAGVTEDMVNHFSQHVPADIDGTVPSVWKHNELISVLYPSLRWLEARRSSDPTACRSLTSVTLYG
jgi:hypothetical protein